jgi:hypothetical protein
MRKPFEGDYAVSQWFGEHPEVYKQFLIVMPDGTSQPMKGHNGIDFKTPTGTPILAPISGIVKESALDKEGYGNYIKIENDQFGVVLAHLELISVQIGAPVKEGDRIGTSDNTGYSTGPHLHMGVYPIPRERTNGFGGYINFAGLLNLQTVKEEGIKAPETAKLYTKEEYDGVMVDREKFWKERDEALANLKVVTLERDELKSIVTAFSALGYNKVEDITKALGEKDEIVTGLQKEIQQTTTSNAILADELKKKNEEDSTAIEMGIDAVKELKELKLKWDTVVKEAHVNPAKGMMELFSVVDTIREWRNKADKLLKQTQKEAKITDAQVVEVKKEIKKEAEEHGLTWLTKTLGLTSIFIASVSLTTLIGTFIVGR